MYNSYHISVVFVLALLSPPRFRFHRVYTVAYISPLSCTFTSESQSGFAANILGVEDEQPRGGQANTRW